MLCALPEFNQSLLDFFNLFDSRLTLTLLYDSLNLVINAFRSGLFGGMAEKKKGSAAAVGLCCTHNVSMCCLLQGNAEALDIGDGKQSII